MKMIERFKGVDGRRRLIDALRFQQVVHNDEHVAKALAEKADLLQISAGNVLINQGAADNDIYLILAGSFLIRINDREIAVRTSGQHVGEMALIDQAAPRAASVIAKEDAVVAKISEPNFAAIADAHPKLWRYLSLELCDRLRQRNQYVPIRNVRPVLFLGSSKESLHVARAIQDGLTHDDILVRVWTDQIFGASHFPIEDLEQQVQASDFAALVLSPDDKVTSRGLASDVPRDNIVFELGLFMGALTRHRTFLITPFTADIKIPTDLLGLTPFQYKAGSLNDMPALIAPLCNALRQVIAKAGPK